MNKRKKILMIIDMQNDFITGVLGTPEAQAIVPKVVDKIKDKAKKYDYIFITEDLHTKFDYDFQREARHLPIYHCIKGTWGQEIHPDITSALNEYGNKKTCITSKEQFELDDWASLVESRIILEPLTLGEDIDFELCGLCTDICVVSNAFAIRQAFPEAEITIDASCCAGTTPEAHKAALMTMKSCQMNIINE